MCKQLNFDTCFVLLAPYGQQPNGHLQDQYTANYGFAPSGNYGDNGYGGYPGNLNIDSWTDFPVMAKPQFLT